MANTFFPPIAVVGLSGVFPKATGGDDFWRNIVAKIDATNEVPAERWVGPVDWVYDRSPKPDMATVCQVEPSELRRTLPPDMKLAFFYDQSEIVRASVGSAWEASGMKDGAQLGLIMAAWAPFGRSAAPQPAPVAAPPPPVVPPADPTPITSQPPDADPDASGEDQPGDG